MMIIGDDICYDIVGQIAGGYIGQLEEDGEMKQHVLPFTNPQNPLGSIDYDNAYPLKKEDIS